MEKFLTTLRYFPRAAERSEAAEGVTPLTGVDSTPRGSRGRGRVGVSNLRGLVVLWGG
jgi:hypothetical protein